mmetsp:Transcript_45396/g.145661  ORF Transcript_45396/g.145661 Transcript_45396/m.145661 type:complete len:572 (-) Transcript_45396:5233-6948(-)
MAWSCAMHCFIFLISSDLRALPMSASNAKFRCLSMRSCRSASETLTSPLSILWRTPWICSKSPSLMTLLTMSVSRCCLAWTPKAWMLSSFAAALCITARPCSNLSTSLSSMPLESRSLHSTTSHISSARRMNSLSPSSSSTVLASLSANFSTPRSSPAFAFSTLILQSTIKAPLLTSTKCSLCNNAKSYNLFSSCSTVASVSSSLNLSYSSMFFASNAFLATSLRISLIASASSSCCLRVSSCFLARALMVSFDKPAFKKPLAIFVSARRCPSWTNLRSNACAVRSRVSSNKGPSRPVGSSNTRRMPSSSSRSQASRKRSLLCNSATRRRAVARRAAGAVSASAAMVRWSPSESSHIIAVSITNSCKLERRFMSLEVVFSSHFCTSFSTESSVIVSDRALFSSSMTCLPELLFIPFRNAPVCSCHTYSCRHWSTKACRGPAKPLILMSLLCSIKKSACSTALFMVSMSFASTLSRSCCSTQSTLIFVSAALNSSCKLTPRAFCCAAEGPSVVTFVMIACNSSWLAFCKASRRSSRMCFSFRIFWASSASLTSGTFASLAISSACVTASSLP